MTEYLRGSNLGGVTIIGISGWQRYMTDDQAEALLGCRFLAPPVTRKAKYMLFHTSGGILLCHNKFTGYWDLKNQPWSFDYIEYDRDPTKEPRDIRMVLDLHVSKDEYDQLRFHDARTLGDLTFYDGIDNPTFLTKLTGMGPDVVHTPNLDFHFHHRWEFMDFQAKMRRTGQAIKLALLDQKNQAGIGNIAACEALWTARINPETSAKTLATADLRRLFVAVQAFMTLAINNKVQYDKYIGVFRRKECRTCGTAIERIVQANRGTYLCPSCQRLPITVNSLSIG